MQKVRFFSENFAKNWNINFQKWFPKYNFEFLKYIKNLQVRYLGTTGVERVMKPLYYYIAKYLVELVPLLLPHLTSVSKQPNK